MPTFASCRSWTDVDIAALTPRDIAQLNYDEMLELVAFAEPARNRTDHGPQVTESDVLVRLVYAVRERCRDKIDVERQHSEGHFTNS